MRRPRLAATIPAVEMAKVLPGLDALSPADLYDVVVRRDFRNVVGYWPSRGEQAVLDAARALQTLGECCDADTVDAVLGVFARLRGVR